MADKFEVSAAYLGSVIEAARACEVLPRVLPKLEGEALEAVNNPHARQWWPGLVSNRLQDAVLHECGAEALQKVTQLALEKRLSRFVMPLIGVALTVSGNSPAVIFNRFGTLTSIAVKGLKMDYEELTKTSGRLRAVFPHPIAPSSRTVWTTTLQFAYALCKRQGRVTTKSLSPESMEFHLEWDA